MSKALPSINSISVITMSILFDLIKQNIKPKTPNIDLLKDDSGKFV